MSDFPGQGGLGYRLFSSAWSADRRLPANNPDFAMNCRHCGLDVVQPFIDLGSSPPSNAYVTTDSAPETYFPLRVMVCTNCWLAQTQDFARPDHLFGKDYAYFSSVSTGWLRHASDYVDMIIDRLGLNKSSYVVEVAANDGYLLKNFVAADIPCLGIEPTESTATAAEALNIPIIRRFFGVDLAKSLVADNKRADLIIGNNVYAHVPDINDFSAGLKLLLKHGGVVTLEFPHVLRLIERTQFDTIYHEHFSYLSLHAVNHIFTSVGLRIWDVEELGTHGGSLRIFGCHAEDQRPHSHNVSRILAEEERKGLLDPSTYQNFQQCADDVKNAFVTFLIDRRREGRSVAGYGAAAKGNTLLNYAGVRHDLLHYICDAGASKQGKYMPGSHIPILHPIALRERRPDYIVIFPWNIADEVIAQHGYVKEWGGRFVTAVPELREF